MPKVLISGTFDVENFGDCLFPIIARERLGQHGYEVAAVAPTACRTRWTDALSPVSVLSLAQSDEQIAGGLIGGGNIIHARPDRLQTYRAERVADLAYPSLWLAFSLILSCRGIPVLWNAPGVPGALGSWADHEAVRQILSYSSYTTVRDEASRANLEGLAQAAVVPDTAAEISRIWPRRELEAHFRDVVQNNPARAAKYIAIHIKHRAVRIGYKGLANLIEEQCRRLGLSPILVSLAPCHGDDDAVAAVSKHLTVPHILLNNSVELKELVSVLAHADAFVGPSLHGYITSYSYGTPGALVAQPRLPKFEAFAHHVGREADVVDDWPQAFQALDSLAPRREAPILPAVQEQLDAHWNAIGRKLTQDSSEKIGRINTYVLQATSNKGLEWLLEPVLRRPKLSAWGRGKRWLRSLGKRSRIPLASSRP